MAEPRPIAWTALSRGAPVQTSEGETVGTVAEVVADVANDIFSGIAVDTGAFRKPVFVPADHVGELTDEAVTIALSATEIESLEPYEG